MGEPLEECPKCGRSSTETIRFEERKIDGDSAVLICRCGYFKEVSG